MKKYFVVTDTHGYYSLLKDTLEEKGFNIENSEHVLILCGDAFDRGPENVGMFNFLKQLKALDRLVYIRGNHEDLLIDCYNEFLDGFGISEHHVHNRTINTVFDFVDNKIIHEVINFINDNCVDYFEIDDYVFVHGWIPYVDNWREGKKQDWKDARWKNGMESWKYGYVDDLEKTIVCGHWHCSFGNSHYHLNEHLKEFPDKNQKNWEESFKPFIDNGIIALDACTAWSKLINCLVINEKS